MFNSEKYVFWVTFRTLGSMRQGKVKLRHNVQGGWSNYQKMLETFWDNFDITIHEDNFLLKDFWIWARDFWKIQILKFFYLIKVCSILI